MGSGSVFPPSPGQLLPHQHADVVENHGLTLCWDFFFSGNTVDDMRLKRGWIDSHSTWFLAVLPLRNDLEETPCFIFVSELIATPGLTQPLKSCLLGLHQVGCVSGPARGLGGQDWSNGDGALNDPTIGRRILFCFHLKGR